MPHESVLYAISDNIMHTEKNETFPTFINHFIDLKKKQFFQLLKLNKNIKLKYIILVFLDFCESESYIKFK
jgi:hypothetical protein